MRDQQLGIANHCTSREKGVPAATSLATASANRLARHSTNDTNCPSDRMRVPTAAWEVCAGTHTSRPLEARTETSPSRIAATLLQRWANGLDGCVAVAAPAAAAVSTEKQSVTMGGRQGASASNNVMDHSSAPAAVQPVRRSCQTGRNRKDPSV